MSGEQISILDVAATSAVAPTTDPSEQLDAKQSAERFGVRVQAWYLLVKASKAPPPVSSRPAKWTAQQIDELKKTIPLLEEVEAGGEWVWVQNTSISWQSFCNYQKKGLIEEERDYVKKLVRAKRPRGTIVVPLVFVRVGLVEQLAAGEAGRRSASAKRWREQKEKLHEGRDTLVSPRAAIRCLHNIHYKTLLRWSSDEQGGCVYLGRALTALYRDKDGRPVPPGKGAWRYWLLSELEAVCRARNALAKNPADPSLCTVEEASRLTGLPVSTLVRAKECEALSLDRVKVAAKSTCERQEGKPGKEKWVRQTDKVRFVRASVERYARTQPNLQQSLKLPAHLMPPGQAAKELGIDHATVGLWRREGLLDGTDKPQRYWTSRGPRTGNPVTRKSVAAAKAVLESVNGDVDKAGQ